MHLKGSCHCGEVQFELDSKHPYPYQHCYCSICRKVGGAGSAVNLGGDAKTLKVTSGEDKITIYNAKIRDEEAKVVKVSEAQRRFCKICGSALWLDDPRWPELVHPFATAIDTPLPKAPEKTHIMLGSIAPWIDLDHTAYNDQKFDIYPEESIAQWHQRLTLEDPQ
ncbi:hypothetical protein KFL_001320120 [Klebsormidium nitens]|uniref:CENP-V/GFA domain-containing protein n=1 Tax=Klebsormidium nitens TaxID=105231 RepID=A0A1Y1HWI3_KLENI|nr:hypothetical protein KFL_001320120 [Klebsormidium nitens]|eukprot:GAQ83004.1 hypothetical protein KFL_001320120 [Klebsormidium nitens]